MKTVSVNTLKIAKIETAITMGSTQPQRSLLRLGKSPFLADKATKAMVFDWSASGRTKRRKAD